MEAQIEAMDNNLEQLKSAAARRKEGKAMKKQQQEQRHHHCELPPAPSTSKPTPNRLKAASKKTKKKLFTDDDVFTFEHKSDLNETIFTLEGAKLETVINIIREGEPKIYGVSFDVVVPLSLSDMSCRAQKRLNLKLIPFPQAFPPGSTTSSLVH